MTSTAKNVKTFLQRFPMIFMKFRIKTVRNNSKNSKFFLIFFFYYIEGVFFSRGVITAVIVTFNEDG
jgi:hypothetical protein